jgi:hypothetical protein
MAKALMLARATGSDTRGLARRRTAGGMTANRFGGSVRIRTAVGSGGQAHCRLDPGHNAVAVFNDCDAHATYCDHGKLLVGMMSLSGVTGPTRLATCDLRSRGVPKPEDLSVSVISATAPNLRPIEMEVRVADVDEQAFAADR